MLARVPSNAALDARWREVVRGREPDLDVLPAEVRAAAQVVLAAQASSRGEEAESARRLRAARTPQFPAFTPEDLRTAVSDAAVAQLLAGARER